MHTQVQVQAWAGPHSLMAAACFPTVRGRPFHWRLIYSLEGYVSVYTVLGPGDRAMKMDLGVQCPGVASTLGSSQPPHEGGCAGMTNVPHHTRGNTFRETKTLGPTASEFRSQPCSMPSTAWTPTQTASSSPRPGERAPDRAAVGAQA